MLFLDSNLIIDTYLSYFQPSRRNSKTQLNFSSNSCQLLGNSSNAIGVKSTLANGAVHQRRNSGINKTSPVIQSSKMVKMIKFRLPWLSTNKNVFQVPNNAILSTRYCGLRPFDITSTANIAANSMPSLSGMMNVYSLNNNSNMVVPGGAIIFNGNSGMTAQASPVLPGTSLGNQLPPTISQAMTPISTVPGLSLLKRQGHTTGNGTGFSNGLGSSSASFKNAPNLMGDPTQLMTYKNNNPSLN